MLVNHTHQIMQQQHHSNINFNNNNDNNHNQNNINDDITNQHILTELLDKSNDPQADYKVILFGYITPIFFLITLAANIMIVLVLSRPTMKSPTNLVLLSMAVADLLTLVFPIPWYFYMYTLGYYKLYLKPSLICNLYYIMSDILPTFFHTASIWCTLLLACQRYIYICHPTMAKVWCTNQRVTRAIFLIFLLAFIHQLLRFFEIYFEDFIVITTTMTTTTTTATISVEQNQQTQNLNLNNQNPHNQNQNLMIKQEEQKNACRIIRSSWILLIEDLYYGTYYLFRIVFVHIGPCLLLVIFNVLLYNALKKAEETRNKLLNKHQNHNSNTNTNQYNHNSIHHAQQQQQQIKNGSEIVVVGSTTKSLQDKKLESKCTTTASNSDIPEGAIVSRGSSKGRSINHQQQNPSHHSHPHPHHRSNRGRDANSTTVMLIVVVTVFLTVEIPLAIATAVHVIENLLKIEFVSDQFLFMIITFSNFFIIISYPLNFAIYCGMSRSFRETFQEMFLKRFSICSKSSSTSTSTSTSASILTSIARRRRGRGGGDGRGREDVEIVEGGDISNTNTTNNTNRSNNNNNKTMLTMISTSYQGDAASVSGCVGGNSGCAAVGTNGGGESLITTQFGTTTTTLITTSTTAGGSNGHQPELQQSAGTGTPKITAKSIYIGNDDFDVVDDEKIKLEHPQHQKQQQQQQQLADDIIEQQQHNVINNKKSLNDNYKPYDGATMV